VPALQVQQSPECKPQPLQTYMKYHLRAKSVDRWCREFVWLAQGPEFDLQHHRKDTTKTLTR
jgi:hypothetical protein